MIKHLEGFIRGTQGRPDRESIMPIYKYYDKDNPGGITEVTYEVEQLGKGNFYYRRKISEKNGGVWESWVGPYGTVRGVRTAMIADSEIQFHPQVSDTA